MMFSAVCTKDEQKVFSTQGTNGRVQEDNRLRMLPQPCRFEREIERRRCNGPVELDQYLALFFEEFTHLALARKEGDWPFVPPVIALSQQQVLGTPYIFFA